MRRREICVYLGAIFAGGIGVMEKANAEAWVIEDGLSEMTPVYIMTHKHGEDFAFVRANFWYWEAKKSVKLITPGAISVNGVDLNAEITPGGISYVGNVPLFDGKFAFKLARLNHQSIEHIFELPSLDIEIPKSYRPPEPVKVPIRYGSPAVVDDAFVMNIKFPEREFSLKGQIGIDEIDFFPIIKVPLPAGRFEANVFRQRRIPLKDISNATKTGWAVASNSRNFTIEVDVPQLKIIP